MSLVRFAGWSGAPWVLLGGVVVLIGSHAWAYGAGMRNGVDQERSELYERLAVAVEQTKKTHEAQLLERGWLDATAAAVARSARMDLQNRLAELAALPPKTLIKTVEVINETGCACAEPSLGSDFWLRYREAGARRVPADPAPAGAMPD